MTVTRLYILVFLLFIYLQTYLLHISTYLYFIILKLQTIFSVARTLIYQAPHSWVWQCAVHTHEMKCSLLLTQRSLHLMRQSLMCVQNTNQSFLSSFQLGLYCALKLQIAVYWSGRSLNSTFYYVHGQGDLSCVEFFVLSSVVCDEWSGGSTSLLRTCYINSLRRTHLEIERNSCYCIYSHSMPLYFDVCFLYT